MNLSDGAKHGAALKERPLVYDSIEDKSQMLTQPAGPPQLASESGLMRTKAVLAFWKDRSLPLHCLTHVRRLTVLFVLVLFPLRFQRSRIGTRACEAQLFVRMDEKVFKSEGRVYSRSVQQTIPRPAVNRN